MTTPPLAPNPTHPDPRPDGPPAEATTEPTPPATGGFTFVAVDAGDAEVCGPDGVCA
ncbi:hypothetical protein [Microlunatus sp. GCM10028923]|uniref:hypothetical protein n=1 Tax=Microlunatus sp. GCM10028923 TaxID=3273400 RepID=UPI0036070201